MSKDPKNKNNIEQLKDFVTIKVEQNKDTLIKFVLPITLVLCLFFFLGRYSVSIDKKEVCKTEIRSVYICNTEKDVLIKEKELLQEQVKSVIKERADYTKSIVEEFSREKENECANKIENIKKEYIKLKCSICK